MVRYFIPLLFAIALIPRLAFGLGYDLPPGNLPRPEAWPAEFYDAVNQPNRVHGHTINQFESLFYRGKAADLNKTIEAIAKTADLEFEVWLSTGPGEAKSVSGKSVGPADWAISVENGERKVRASIRIWLGGSLSLADLKIPAGVKIKDSGEIDAFIRKHEANTK